MKNGLKKDIRDTEDSTNDCASQDSAIFNEFSINSYDAGCFN